MSNQLSLQGVPIEISNEEIRVRLLTNTIKMLVNRKLIKSENQNSVIQKLIDTNSDDMIYQVQLDDISRFPEYKHNYLIIKIFPHKITSITRSTGISEFIHSHKLVPKILIVNGISTKAQFHIESSFANTQVFLEQDLIINLVDHIAVPQHIPLDPSETQKILEEYCAKKRNLPKMFVTDKIARYYNMKPGQMCRIIRPSETAGNAISYRLVIRGSVASEVK